MFKANLGAFLLAVLLIPTNSMAINCAVSVRVSTAPTRLVIITGTIRDGNQTIKVAEEVQSLAQAAGAEVELLDISKIRPGTYRGDRYFNMPHSFVKKYDQKIESADALVIVFPEYDGSYPGDLGTFLNYMRGSLVGKPVALIGHSSGVLGGQKGAQNLMTVLEQRKADLLGGTQVSIPLVDSKIDPVSGKLNDQDVIARIKKVLNTVITSVKTKSDNITQLISMAEKIDESFSFNMNSGARVQAKLGHVLKDKSGRIIFMKWITPTKILDTKGVLESVNEKGIVVKQDHIRHRHGFSSPIGPIIVKGLHRNLSAAKNERDLQELGLIPNERAKLNYVSGVKLEALYKGAIFSHEGKLQLLIFDDATMNKGKKILYESGWGLLDLLVAESVESVQGI